MFQTYPGIKKVEKLYSAKYGEINVTKFNESCKNHEITLSLAKTNYNKVFGFLCPVKFANARSTKIKGG